MNRGRAELAASALVALLVSSFAATGCGSPEPVAHPNIILVISDDLGWPYYGFMGHPIVQTPHLDHLASQGTLFPQAFTTASSCRYSLITLLTGLYPHQWRSRLVSLRAFGVRRGRFRAVVDFDTLPRRLASAGYASFQGGKYWEGSYDLAGFTHGMKDAAEAAEAESTPDVQELAGGASLALGRETMQPLWDFVAAHRDTPFFAWFAPKLPHTPHDAPAAYTRLYRNRGLSPEAAAYYANITRLDDQIGKLLLFLDDMGLRDRTLVVYLSDNGWEQDPEGRPDVRSLGGPHGKSSMFELGYRTPLIFSWPGHVPSGVVRDDLVSTVDLFPTLLDFAGVAAPESRAGRSLYARLLQDAPPVRDTVMGTSATLLRPPPEVERARTAPTTDIVRRERGFFLRTSQWRYVWYFDAERMGDRLEDELYRIDEDARETRNVAAEHPDLIADFRQRILVWMDDTNALMSSAAGRLDAKPSPAAHE